MIIEDGDFVSIELVVREGNVIEGEGERITENFEDEVGNSDKVGEIDCLGEVKSTVLDDGDVEKLPDGEPVVDKEIDGLVMETKL